MATQTLADAGEEDLVAHVGGAGEAAVHDRVVGGAVAFWRGDGAVEGGRRCAFVDGGPGSVGGRVLGCCVGGLRAAAHALVEGEFAIAGSAGQLAVVESIWVGIGFGIIVDVGLLFRMRFSNGTGSGLLSWRRRHSSTHFPGYRWKMSMAQSKLQCPRVSLGAGKVRLKEGISGYMRSRMSGCVTEIGAASVVEKRALTSTPAVRPLKIDAEGMTDILAEVSLWLWFSLSSVVR